ncbi:hypothetical protein IQ07DRAFT_588344 [Pyrenochaeta sp. DS3sAY3a]|nr:hypothetical protein IQ07DRAFT_588344 [Pyrenochaeta sp. DS3sAY3a]
MFSKLCHTLLAHVGRSYSALRRPSSCFAFASSASISAGPDWLVPRPPKSFDWATSTQASTGSLKCPKFSQASLAGSHCC